MRIYDPNTDKKINNIIVYLTPDEAQEMKTALELLINEGEKHHHIHISDHEEDFLREITVCIYKDDNLSGFDERSRNLILHDE